MLARRRRHDQAGTAVVEYAIVLALLVTVCVSVLTYVGSATADRAGALEEELRGAPTTTIAPSGGSGPPTTCAGNSGGRGGGGGRNCR